MEGDEVDIMAAYNRNMAAQKRGDRGRVFDWNKAARMIRAACPKTAAAGLRGDWDATGDTIYRDGNPVTDSYTYLKSTWATPEIDIDGVVSPCFVLADEAPDWDANTQWPPSALAILNSDEATP